MSGFIMGFCCGIGWVPIVFAVWLVRNAFSVPLDLGS